MGPNMYLYKKAREAYYHDLRARWKRDACWHVCLGVRLCGCAACATSAQVSPGSSRAVHRAGSMVIAFIGERSITMPPLLVPYPA